MDTTSILSQALAETEAVARDQISAAWQLHVEKVEEQLRAGWRQQVARVFEDRFAELGRRIQDEFQRQLEERLQVSLQEAREALRRQAAEEFNQAARRLRESDSADQWAEALLDAAAPVCRRAAVLRIHEDRLVCEGARGCALVHGAEIPLAEAPSLAQTVELRDIRKAELNAGEVGETLTAALGGTASRRVGIFPVLLRGRCVAVLLSDAEDEAAADGALELLATLAGAALESRALNQRPVEGLVTIPAERPAPRLPDWFSLPLEEREKHLRAQRFARVKTAEIRLYKAEAVRSGRADHNLYALLKEDLDAAREAFRRDFVATCPSMVDYLHQEVVRTLANEDETLLGADYPGPLA